jgi:hypothetical protein
MSMAARIATAASRNIFLSIGITLFGWDWLV